MSKPKLVVIVDGDLSVAGPDDIDNIEGLGTAATKDVATNAEALAGNAGVLPDAEGVHAAFKQYGYGGQNPNNNSLNCNDLPPGVRNTWSDSAFNESEAVSLNLPALGGSPDSARSWHVECFGTGASRLVQEATEVFGIGTTQGRTFIRVKHDSTWYSWQEIQTTGNILPTTGQSTQYSMTQKAVTDALTNSGSLASTGATYEYDALGRVDKIVTPNGDTVIAYNPNGAVDTITYPTGRVESYTYDASGNVTAMTATGG